MRASAPSLCVCRYFLAIHGSICIYMPLCKIKEWATWAHNDIPMMQHAARYSTSFTKLALWAGGLFSQWLLMLLQPSCVTAQLTLLWFIPFCQPIILVVRTLLRTVNIFLYDVCCRVIMLHYMTLFAQPIVFQVFSFFMNSNFVHRIWKNEKLWWSGGCLFSKQGLWSFH